MLVKSWVTGIKFPQMNCKTHNAKMLMCDEYKNGTNALEQFTTSVGGTSVRITFYFKQANNYKVHICFNLVRDLSFRFTSALSRHVFAFI
jgi:hypothetical protein